LTGLVALGCAGKTTGDTVGQSRMGLRRMQSCAELESALRQDALVKMNKVLDQQIKYVREGYGENYGGGVSLGAPRGEASGAPEAPSAGSADDASGGSGGGRASSYSDTNTQVKGIDEADIVKTDGKNIFLLHGTKLMVLNAWPTSSLAVASSAPVEGSPLEMYTAGDKVVVYSIVDGKPIYDAAGVTPKEGYSDGYGSIGVGRPGVATPDIASDGASYPGYVSTPLTKVSVYNLEGTQPKLARELYYEGQYLSSRRIDNAVRTVLVGGAHGPKLQYWLEDSEFKTKYPQSPSKDQIIAELEALRTKNRRAIESSTKEDWLPVRFTKNGGAVTAGTTRCEDFYVPPPGTTEYGMTQIEAIDLAAPEAGSRGAAILGAVDTVYSSFGSMYLAARGWADPELVAVAMGSASSSDDVAVAPPSGSGSSGSGSAGSAPTRDAAEPAPTTPNSLGIRTEPVAAATGPVTLNYTHLHRFDLNADPSVPVYVASGSVPGQIKDQFSLDEKDGHLRISTTENRAERRRGWSQVNDLFVLGTEGSELVVKGSVTGLAPDERVYSTRFVGNRGYVVTFRQVDPLFVFDLSNPSSPELLGELKIPGFSEYMHPLDDGHLLTIGRDADEQTGQVRGLALQIFDVTNPRAPRQSAKFTFSSAEYGFSEAQGNHKAFTYFADKKLLAFPYVAYDNRSGNMRSSLEVFRIEAPNTIAKVGSVDHTAFFRTETRNSCGYSYYGPQVRRGLFLEDFVYSVSHGGVLVNDVRNIGPTVASLSLPAPEAPANVCGGDTGGGAVPPTEARE
jgi:hypothetical protein